jgi:8-hydroxy-5-deazaflavin:NADPH oxidoreductase
VPFDAALSVLEPQRAALLGKTLVDVTNPITPDHRDLAFGHSDSGAERIARAFPEVHVVKAFNAVFAEVYQARTAQLGGRSISIFFAGDDAGSKQRVSGLIESLGFDPVDAGPLRNARFLEPLSLLNIQLGRVLGHGTAIGFSLARPSA